MHAGRYSHVQQSQVLSDYVQVHDNGYMDKKSSLVLRALSESSDCNTAFELPSMVFMRPSGAAARIALAREARCRSMPATIARFKRAAAEPSRCVLVSTTSRPLIAGDGASFIFDSSAGTITLNLGSWKTANTQGLRFLVPAGRNPCGAHQLRRQRGTGVQEYRAARHAGCARRGGQAGEAPRRSVRSARGG